MRSFGSVWNLSSILFHKMISYTILVLLFIMGFLVIALHMRLEVGTRNESFPTKWTRMWLFTRMYPHMHF